MRGWRWEELYRCEELNRCVGEGERCEVLSEVLCFSSGLEVFSYL